MPWSKMVDLEYDDEDSIDEMHPAMVEKPRYPYGLRLCFTHKELKKLGLEPDCSVGDLIDIRAFGEVTSVSASDGPSGKECRIEIQIQKIALEDEMKEGPDDDD